MRFACHKCQNFIVFSAIDPEMANRGAVWANAEVATLIAIWREEDIEAQLGGSAS